MGIDGGILPALPAGADAGDEGGGAEGGLANAPDALCFGGGVDAGGRLCGKGFEIGDEGASFGVRFGLGVSAEFDDEEAVAAGE